MDIYYDARMKVKQTELQLRQRGLMRSGVDLAAIEIYPFVIDHDIDTDLYFAIYTGESDIRDGKAYGIFERKRRSGTSGIDIKAIMQTKLNEMRDLTCASGVAFSIAGETSVLQTREGDWVTLDHLLRDAEKADPEDVMGIRVESNTEVSMNAAAVITLIEEAITYRNAVIKAASTLKDQISAAADDDAAYDVYEAGIDSIWPDRSPVAL